jgi:dinuclear metal center YbgI/SA1388 family protein
MPCTLQQISEFLRSFAPVELAADWDNVGLLIGDEQRPVQRVMTCLTLTPDVAAEAAAGQAELVVSHHPVLFRPVQRLTTATSEGRAVLSLIAAGIAVYSPHTAFDNAAEGINRELAERFGLQDIAPLRPVAASDAPSVAPTAVGEGRYGRLPAAISLGEFIRLVRARMKVSCLQWVGDEALRVERVAVACGAAAEFVRDAAALRCDVLLTGEARFHACLEARELGVALVLPGHYATERPSVERLAERLATEFPALTVWASRVECDPVRWSAG